MFFHPKQKDIFTSPCCLWLPVLALWWLHFCNLLLFCVCTKCKNYLFIMPCVFLVHYMYITDPILGLICFCSLSARFVLITVYHALYLPCILHVHYWSYSCRLLWYWYLWYWLPEGETRCVEFNSWAGSYNNKGYCPKRGGSFIYPVIPFSQSWLKPTGFHGFTKTPPWSQILNSLMLALWIDWTEQYRPCVHCWILTEGDNPRWQMTNLSGICCFGWGMFCTGLSGYQGSK